MNSILTTSFGSSYLLPFDAGDLLKLSTEKRRRSKRGTDRRTSAASIDSFEAIKKRRVRLYLPILDNLALHGLDPGQCLTARELLRRLKAQGHLAQSAERNDVSPRLSELLDAGCVENPPFFLKRVGSDATATVWRITERGRLLSNHLHAQGAKR